MFLPAQLPFPYLDLLVTTRIYQTLPIIGRLARVATTQVSLKAIRKYLIGGLSSFPTSAIRIKILIKKNIAK